MPRPRRRFRRRCCSTIGTPSKSAASRFDLLHTPGETPDHLTVWIPEFKAAFIGDNFYESFPNLYTLRGTETR